MPQPVLGVFPSTNGVTALERLAGTQDPVRVQQEMQAWKTEWESKLFRWLQQEQASTLLSLENLLNDHVCNNSPPVASTSFVAKDTSWVKASPAIVSASLVSKDTSWGKACPAVASGSLLSKEIPYIKEPKVEDGRPQAPQVDAESPVQYDGSARSSTASNEMDEIAARSQCGANLPKKVGKELSARSKERAAVGEGVCKVIGWTDNNDKDPDEAPAAELQGFKPVHPFQERLANFVHSNQFQVATSCLVIANSCMIGMALDQDVTRALKGEDPVPWEKVSDLLFTLGFALELGLRMYAERCHFFKGPGKWWNYFDFVVVVTGILELLDLINFKLTFLRVLRVVKVAKVFRVIRVLKFFRELRMMALSIISCMVSVVWAFVFLFMVMYVFALVLLEGARDYLRPSPGSAEVDPMVQEALDKWFNGIWQSIFSLIQAVSGGNSWGDLARPFSKISFLYALSFTLFITFVTFGLLNVLVGVFVSNTGAIADLDRDFVIREEMDRRNSAMNQMRGLFTQLDLDGTGTLSWSELAASLDDPSVKGYFELVDIEVDEAEGLFRLLDVDESGEVGIEEFILGCMRLKGAAKSLDVATLMYENKRMYQLLNSFMNEMRDQAFEAKVVAAGKPESWSSCGTDKK